TYISSSYLNKLSMKSFVLLFFAFLSSIYVVGQTREITGIVKDENGSPLAGARVRLGAATTGVSTDADGTFGLRIPQPRNQTLLVDLMGFKSKTVPVGASGVLDI